MLEVIPNSQSETISPTIRVIELLPHSYKMEGNKPEVLKRVVALGRPSFSFDLDHEPFLFENDNHLKSASRTKLPKKEP